ncbi:hypothetical protein D3C75_1085190 [compost metagenome]
MTQGGFGGFLPVAAVAEHLGEGKNHPAQLFAAPFVQHPIDHIQRIIQKMRIHLGLQGGQLGVFFTDGG